MKFINVVGTSASGKTTFARQLAKKLGLIHIEMDDLFWLDNWQETPDDEFFLNYKIEWIKPLADGYLMVIILERKI